MKIEAFVIHLERAVERRANVARLVQACPVPTHVVAAVDARALSPSEIDAVYKKNLYQPRYPFNMRKGEIACFLSHRKAWQAIIDRGLDAGLVFEDDVEIDSPVFCSALALATESVADFGIIQLRSKSVPSGIDHSSISGCAEVFRPKIVQLGMVCNLYSNSTAKQLLSASSVFDRPVDGLLQMPWITSVYPVVVQPSGIYEVSAKIGGSTIQKGNKSVFERLYHELVRPVYRYQIAKWTRETYV